MGPFHTVAFGCALSSTAVDLGFWVFLLSSILKSGRKGKKRGEVNSAEHLTTALRLMQNMLSSL